MRALVVVAGMVTLAVGIASPEHVDVLAAGVALATLGMLAGSALSGRVESPRDPIAPFGPDAPPAAPAPETPDVTELVREIAEAGRALPPRVAARLREVARGRLLDGHRLDVTHPADAARARERLGPMLAAVVFDEAMEIPTRRLPDLLDELERL